MDALDAIFARRSIGRLTEPAPSPDDLLMMLRAAAAAPDHGELQPWEFIVLQGDAKVAFGDVLADAYIARCADEGIDPQPAKVDKERTKLGRAPVVVVVAAVRKPSDKIPWVEQQAAAAAATQNLLLAATAFGYGSMWRTGDPARDPRVKAALRLREHDEVMAFVYLGTPAGGSARNAKRPSVGGMVREWRPGDGRLSLTF